MIKSFATALVAFSLFSVAAQNGFADNPCGARWYPFYGYRQPTYLAQPAVVGVQPTVATVQPDGAQFYSTNYWPSETTVARPAGSYLQPSTSGKWYPFYGYRRPAYLGR